MKNLQTEKPIASLILSIWLPTNPEKETQGTLTKLFLQWASNISPFVNLDKPKIRPKDIPRSNTNIWDPNISPFYWGMSLEVGRSILFLKSINHLSRDAYSFFYKYDQNVKITLAPNKKSSWALSRYGGQAIKVVCREDLKEQFLNYPIECLELEVKILSSLKEIRVNKIKELAQIETKELNERYGREVSQALTDLIEGEESITELPEREKRIFCIKTLEHSIQSQETFFELIKISLKEICNILKNKHLSSSQFDFSLFFEKQNFINLSFPLNIPLDSDTLAWKILKPRLENISYEGCFSVTTLAKQLKEKEELSQTLIATESIKEADEDPLKILLFLEEISGTLNDNSIKIYKQEYSHLEEDAGRVISLGTLKTLLETNQIKSKHLKLKNNLKELSRQTAPYLDDRPSIIVSEPIRIEVTKSNSNLNFKLRNISLLIKNIIGPERINTNWWHEEQDILNKTRSYYKMQLETGLWIWTYKDIKNSCWLLHGIWS